MAEAARYSLVNAVAALAALIDRARALAEAIAAGAALTMQATEEVAHGTAHLRVREAFEAVKSGAFPT